jgi:hypothetical protein
VQLARAMRGAVPPYLSETKMRSSITMKSLGLAVVASLSVACGSSSDPSTPVVTHDTGVADTSSAIDTGAVVDDTGSVAVDTGTAIDTGTLGDTAAPTACTTFTKTTIAAMRAGKSGCYELDTVVSIGTTPSTKSPTLYVQDAAGGDLSAIVAKCSSTSTAHPCTVASSVAAIADGRSVTITGDYVKSKTSGIEDFYVTSITDLAAATAPAPGLATLAEVARGAKTTRLWYQKVSVTLAAPETLKMYDWTPAELAYAGATKCPYQFGFGMLPSAVTATAGMACSGTTSQPAGVSMPDAAEILVGTDFYKTFLVTSDCRCNATFKVKTPTATSAVTGTFSGILNFDVPSGATTGYQFVMPKADADFPISGTM